METVRKIPISGWKSIQLVVALTAGLLVLAPVAQGKRVVTLSLNVNFFINGNIAVTLPDGTPLGSTSGAPTAIPPGFYTFSFSGPGGCFSLPYFHLTGPGVNIVTNLSEGNDAMKVAGTANFQPNSTYFWTNDGFPGVVHTFVTSAVIESTAAVPASSTNTSSSKHRGTVTSSDIVGSQLVPFRGTLTAAVSTSGRLTLAYKGNKVTRLKAGRYRIAVSDESSKNGFILEKPTHASVSLTGIAFEGERSASVNLTVGNWHIMPRPGKTASSLVVS